MKTVIMAGGRGTRISEMFPDIPKPLIPIDGVPVLEREIISLHNQGFDDIIITISHMGDKIKEYFEDGRKWNVNIQYFEEKIPLGNAGALFKIRNLLGKEPFLLLNADAMFEVDFNRMLKFHKEHKALVACGKTEKKEAKASTANTEINAEEYAGTITSNAGVYKTFVNLSAYMSCR